MNHDNAHTLEVAPTPARYVFVNGEYKLVHREKRTRLLQFEIDLSLLTRSGHSFRESMLEAFDEMFKFPCGVEVKTGWFKARPHKALRVVVNVLIPEGVEVIEHVTGEGRRYTWSMRV